MRVIKPITVTDSIFVSSNVSESDYTEWASGQSITIGDYRQVTTVEPDIHKVYEAVQTHTTANDDNRPWLDGDETHWVEVGSTNRWKAWDSFNESKTVNADTIEVTIDPGEIVNAVSVLNVTAQTVQVIVTDPIDGEVYNATVNMIEPPPESSWYSWFFSPVLQKTDVIFDDLPNYSTAEIEVIIDNTGSDAECGVIVYGQAKRLGTADYGTSVGIIDYSVKTVDDFGRTTITPRSFSDTADYRVTINTNDVTPVKKFLTEIRSTPCVWIGSEYVDATIVYGYYKDFDVVISNYSTSECNINVEGLT